MPASSACPDIEELVGCAPGRVGQTNVAVEIPALAQALRRLEMCLHISNLACTDVGAVYMRLFLRRVSALARPAGSARGEIVVM